MIFECRTQARNVRVVPAEAFYVLIIAVLLGRTEKQRSEVFFGELYFAEHSLELLHGE